MLPEKALVRFFCFFHPFFVSLFLSFSLCFFAVPMKGKSILKFLGYPPKNTLVWGKYLNYNFKALAKHTTCIFVPGCIKQNVFGKTFVGRTQSSLDVPTGCEWEGNRLVLLIKFTISTDHKKVRIPKCYT